MAPEVTFLLTEVVGSIERWEADEAGTAASTERLDAIVATATAAHRGTQVKPRGEGDSHFLVFDDPVDAVACSVALQEAVAGDGALPLRSGCNVGHADFRDGDWYGTTVNRCARLRAAAHGHQSLVSKEVAAAIAASSVGLPSGVTLRPLGRHRLKDLDEPVEVFQVCGPGLVEEHPPLSTLAWSHGLPLPRSSFVGRTRELAQVVGHLQSGAVVRLSGAPGAGTTRLALEAAARWFDLERRPVHLVTGDGSWPDRDPGDLLVADDPAAVPADLEGPAVVTGVARISDGAAVELRVAPLDDFDAEHLLRERLAGDAHLPPGSVILCDGLPLAIELLARRAGSVDPIVLCERLAANPLAVLGGDRRADPPRHASLRATFAAAFERLDTEEKEALLAARPGDDRWVAAGWHEPSGPLPLVAAFLAAPEGGR